VCIAEAAASMAVGSREGTPSPSKRAMTAWALAARDIEVYVIHASTAISTVTGEDAKRPNRERASLVAAQNRIINRMKTTLMRLGHPQIQSLAEEDRRTP
jgi:hypothetical protein